MNERLRSMIVPEAASIRDAINAIDCGSTGAAFVVDGKGRLVGLVTDGDIRRALLRDVGLQVSIRTIMNTSPETLKPGLEVAKVYVMMLEKHIMCAPILDDEGRVIEFVHLPDLARNYPELHVYWTQGKNRVDKILLIGGAGYIGSVLTRELLNRGYNVRVLDSLMYGEESLKSVSLQPRFELVHGDTRSVDVVLRALADINAVVHLGEIVGDPACQVNPDFTIEVNYLATKRVAEVCRNLGVPRFIFLSSCSVYGASDGILNEDSPVNPVSLYAKCKIEAERAVMSLAQDGFCPTVFRLATVFGLSFRPRFDLVVNLLAAEAVVKKQINIVGGSQWRPFVHVRDVVEMLVQCLEAPLNVIGGEIFNLGYDEFNFRIEELANFIKNVVPDVTIVQDGKSDSRSYRVSCDKIRRRFGQGQGRDIEWGIREIKRAIEDGIVGYYWDQKYSNYLNFVEP